MLLQYSEKCFWSRAGAGAGAGAGLEPEPETGAGAAGDGRRFLERMGEIAKFCLCQNSGVNDGRVLAFWGMCFRVFA